MNAEILTDERLDQIAGVSERWGAVSRKDAVTLIAEVRRLRGLIENAEHGRGCASVFVFAHGVREKCDCWKLMVNA